MTKPKTLIIDAKTAKELITMKEVVKAVEKGFKCFGEGKTIMPPKVYINLKKYNGDFRSMPAYADGLGCCVKWVNVHPDNRKKGLPTVMALIITSDPKTGFPLCVMSASHATAVRTGAAGAVAAKYLAQKDPEIVSFVGCGVQAKAQFEALTNVFKIKHVRLWSLQEKEMAKFKAEIKRKGNIKVELCDTVASCVNNSDIIVTTTPSRKPVVKHEWVKEGAHINAIGADAKGKQELDAKILKNAKIIVDSWEQAAHSGEINVSVAKGIIKRKDIYADIGQIVSGRKKGRTNKKEITVFDSTGLAVQDIAIAELIYKKAKKLKKGQYFNLV